MDHHGATVLECVGCGVITSLLRKKFCLTVLCLPCEARCAANPLIRCLVTPGRMVMERKEGATMRRCTVCGEHRACREVLQVGLLCVICEREMVLNKIFPFRERMTKEGHDGRPA